MDVDLDGDVDVDVAATVVWVCGWLYLHNPQHHDGFHVGPLEVIETELMGGSRRLALVSIYAVFLGACAHHGAPPAARPAAANPSAATSSVPPLTIAHAELTGEWVEFWAVAGRADTQRYAFFADGRFGWRAAEGGNSPIARRWGRFALVPAASETALSVSVEGHEERFGCEGVATRRIFHDPPLEDRLVLGECPPNDEAKTLDANYKCLSISGRAFWRRGPPPEDESQFIPAVTSK